MFWLKAMRTQSPMTWTASPGRRGAATSQALLSWSRTTTPTATPKKTAHAAARPAAGHAAASAVVRARRSLVDPR